MKINKKKILLGIGIGFVLMVVLVLVIAGFFMGNIVKAGMETVGPKVTQTTLTVGAVNVSPLTGSAGINNLIVGSPDGYKATNTISIGKAAVSVAPFSVLSDKIVVKSVEIRDAVITFEGNPLGQNNLKKIMDNVNAFASQVTGPAGTNAPAQKPQEKGAGKKLQVDSILITGAKVNFNGVPLPLPDISLKNLGQGPDGITPVGVVQEVLDQVTAASLKAITSSVGDAGKAIGKEANKIGDAIGNLFKKK
jgi:uncharacterized protein involved in outer membrane biogenesis